MIKKQRTIKQRILAELPKRCYQIGIPAVEQPKIVWNTEQFKWYTGVKKRSQNNLGCCAFKSNVILIDLHNHAFHKENFAEVRDTLIHELVHMRWQNLRHGPGFTDTIKKILKGKIYPPQAEQDKRYRKQLTSEEAHGLWS